ncbi:MULTISPECIES: hypothetical protein [unclassified Pseudomonas]
MIIIDEVLRERVNAIGWGIPAGVVMRVHAVPPVEGRGENGSITVVTEKVTALNSRFFEDTNWWVTSTNLGCVQQEGWWITSKVPATAAIQFALRTDDGMRFLRMFDERDFDTIRREWPDAPATIFSGA